MSYQLNAVRKMCDLMLGAELWVIGDKAGTDGRLVLVEVPPAENTISTQLITQLHTNVDQYKEYNKPRTDSLNKLCSFFQW